MSLVEKAKAQASADVEILGWHFRIRRLTSRELDVYRGYMMLLVNVPDAERVELAKTIRDAVQSGDDLSHSLSGMVGAFLAMVQGQMTPENSKRGEDMRAAILAAGVTHWSDDGSSWRPLRVVVDGEPAEGDGIASPDVVTVRMLPGGGSTEQALCQQILTMSQAGAAEAQRLATFRS